MNKQFFSKGLFLLIFCLTSLIANAQKQFEVYVFLAEKCPISIYMSKPLKEAQATFNESVDFFAVFPMKNSTEKTTKQFLQKYDLEDFEIKLDNYQGFARQLEAQITPEVVILDQAGTVVYRGRISDAYRAPGKMKHGPRKNELLQILKDLTAGKSIPQPWSQAVGCYITFHS